LTRYKNGKKKLQTTLCDQILCKTETECRCSVMIFLSRALSR